MLFLYVSVMQVSSVQYVRLRESGSCVAVPEEPFVTSVSSSVCKVQTLKSCCSENKDTFLKLPLVFLFVFLNTNITLNKKIITDNRNLFLF